MRKKTIAVVGRGTAGSFSIPTLSNRFPEDEIHWYFDPTVSPQAVGEGSTIPVPKYLYQTFGMTYEDILNVNGTLKSGVLKKNWGTKNESFFHDFKPPTAAIHFSATDLQEYILKKSQSILGSRLKIIEGSVDYNNVDADFIINSSGKPSSYEDFLRPEYIPVNSAYVTQCYWDFPRFSHTLAIASKYGWIFGIPLQNRCSIGYIYNSNITTKEEIIEDVFSTFEDLGLTPSSTTNSLSFENYYRKQNYEDGGRIAHNGNASFFLEPLEATSTGLMFKIQNEASDIWSGYLSVDEASSRYTKEIQDIELMIMLHYAAGSKFKTDFWEFAQERAIKKIESYKNNDKFKEIYSVIRDKATFYDANQLPEKFLKYGDFGSWPVSSYLVNIERLGIKPLIDKIMGYSQTSPTSIN
jgi:hypothetical protein